MKFDPKTARIGYLAQDRRWLRRELDTAYDPKRPMGAVAVSTLASVIKITLCGLYEDISPLVPRLLDWLDRAIENDEKAHDNHDFHRMTLHEAKALGTWVRDGADVPEIWNTARQFLDAALRHGNVYSRGDMSTAYLDDYLALCYQAGRYEEGIAEYEKYHGVKTLSLQKAPAPRKVAYALCLHEARQQFAVEELYQAGRQMLQAYVGETWIDRGQYLRAATWLKIVYWHHDRTLTPQQTILKAYDHMPDVPRPDFVSAAA